MIGLGDLPGGSFSSEADGVSADGSVVVGVSSSALGDEAFRWTAAGGVVGLGDLPGGIFSSKANGISSDGSIIVGYGDGGLGAFIWDQTYGMRKLSDVLVNDFALDLSGWTLREARGISADGLTIVGNGINPDGFTEAFVVTLPEPGALSLFALVSLTMFHRRLDVVLRQ